MRAAIALMLLLSACGETMRDDHLANQVGYARDNEALDTMSAAPAASVRIGELGPAFAACSGAGTTRQIAAGSGLPVRAAPFDRGEVVGQIPAGGRFFICSRSHDQKWLGIVHDESGTLSRRCGVSGPVAARGSYEGPCRSGWIASAHVRLVAGAGDEAAPEQS